MRFSHFSILSIVACLSAVPAGASVGWYVGLGAGRAGERDSLQTVTIESQQTGVKLFGGYMIRDLFGVELSTTRFGEFVESAGPATLREDVNNLAALARIELPINDHVFFSAKLGIAYTETDVRLTNDTDELSETRSDSALAWSIGVGGRLSRSISLQLEYDGYETGTVSSLELLSVGFLYRF